MLIKKRSFKDFFKNENKPENPDADCSNCGNQNHKGECASEEKCLFQEYWLPKKTKQLTESERNFKKATKRRMKEQEKKREKGFKKHCGNCKHLNSEFRCTSVIEDCIDFKYWVGRDK